MCMHTDMGMGMVFEPTPVPPVEALGWTKFFGSVTPGNSMPKLGALSSPLRLTPAAAPSTAFGGGATGMGVPPYALGANLIDSSASDAAAAPKRSQRLWRQGLER